MKREEKAAREDGTARRRFYVPPEAFGDGRVRLGADEARHLRSVLRLGNGDEAFAFDGAGREFRCEVAIEARDAVTLAVLEEVAPQRPESELELTLAVALLKGEKFDWVVQKATELGVARIVPVMTKRADVRLDKRKGGTGRDERWARLALEAAKQSGRARVPEVAAPVELSELLRDGDRTHGIMFSERAGVSLTAALEEAGEETASLIALVGPEGGWDDAEIEAAQTAGWRVVTLGGRILRAETAAITVAALLQHRRGDLV